MDHTMNLELKFDDDRMIDRAMSKATEELVKQLKANIFSPKYSGWGRNETTFSKKAEEIVKDWLNENKQELYEIIAKKVAMSVMRSNKFRDILEKEIERVMAEETEEGR